MWEGEVAGFRASNFGGLGNVGASGYAWSSASHLASSVHASALHILSSEVNPEYLHNRAHAFPVRCVQLCVSREQRPLADFAEAKKSGASNGASWIREGRGNHETQTAAALLRVTNGVIATLCVALFGSPPAAEKSIGPEANGEFLFCGPHQRELTDAPEAGRPSQQDYLRRRPANDNNR